MFPERNTNYRTYMIYGTEIIGTDINRVYH